MTPCPICHEEGVVVKTEFRPPRVWGRPAKELRAYIRCPCESIITEWHRPTYNRKGGISKSAVYYAEKEWERLVSHLQSKKQNGIIHHARNERTTKDETP